MNGSMSSIEVAARILADGLESREILHHEVVATQHVENVRLACLRFAIDCRPLVLEKRDRDEIIAAIVAQATAFEAYVTGGACT